MHDPETLFTRVVIPYPRIKKPKYNFQKRWIQTYTIAEIWYVDPTGRDADRVLWNKMGKWKFFWKNIKDFQIWNTPYSTIKRKFRRCSECGLMGNKNNRVNFGYMSSRGSYHEGCMDLRHYRLTQPEFIEAIGRLNITSEQLFNAGMSDKNSACWRVAYAGKHWRESQILEQGSDK